MNTINQNQNMKKHRRIVLDPFCLRQFKLNQFNHIPYDPKLFQAKLNQFYQTAELLDGYAGFCKYFYVQNFPNIKRSILEITNQNQSLLKTSYEARNQHQLPVLKRYFPREKVQVQNAKYLLVILYTREQVQLQDQATGQADPNKQVDYDFGIIAVKPQEDFNQLPMEPITMMRNGLGKQYGGSGHKINKALYIQSVNFWQHHALIK